MNPYQSPRGIDDGQAGATIFPWPRLRRLIRPLLGLLVIGGIMAWLWIVVGSRIGSTRQELRDMRAESMSRLRQNQNRPQPPAGLSGNPAENQP